MRVGHQMYRCTLICCLDIIVIGEDDGCCYCIGSRFQHCMFHLHCRAQMMWATIVLKLICCVLLAWLTEQAFLLFLSYLLFNLFLGLLEFVALIGDGMLEFDDSSHMGVWFGVLVEEHWLVDSCSVGWRRGGGESAVQDLVGSNFGIWSSGWDCVMEFDSVCTRGWLSEWCLLDV